MHQQESLQLLALMDQQKNLQLLAQMDLQENLQLLALMDQQENLQLLALMEQQESLQLLALMDLQENLHLIQQLAHLYLLRQTLYPMDLRIRPPPLLALMDLLLKLPILLQMCQLKKQQLVLLLLRWRASAWMRAAAPSTMGWANASISPRTWISWAWLGSMTWRQDTSMESAETPRRNCVTAASA